jgi:tyrosine-protein kinase Etk/Wzc
MPVLAQGEPWRPTAKIAEKPDKIASYTVKNVVTRGRMIEAEVQSKPAMGAERFSSSESETSLLDFLIVLLEHKRFIAWFVLGAAALSTIIAFLLPVRYEGKIMLLPPAQNSSLSSALLGQLGNLGALGSLASLAGGGLNLKNPADMYVSLLTSRTVEDAMIHRFGLMQEYHEKRMIDTRKELERRSTINAGIKDGLIRLSVEDRDPKRAAELANGYVEEFRKLSESLAITEAQRRRLFFQQQVETAKNELTKAENAMTQTQETTGVVEIGSQARALIESAAILRAQVAAKQVQIDGMRSFAAEDNPELKLAKQELASLQSQLQRVASSDQDPGSDINLSKGRVTQAGMEYLRRYRDLKYQETVFELLAKEFEIAKLDEAREGSIVQVVDPAVVPDKKSSPHRLLIVIASTILATFVAIFWVGLRRRFAVASELPENRHRLQVVRDLWKWNLRNI